MHLELPIASFICAVLSLAPLPWHWRAGTVPTVSIALWLFVSNLINGVNTIVWAGNVRIVSPIWCDISTKIIIGANVALPASIFCLCIHLERVSSIRQISTSHVQKRRRQWFDGLMCFGIPMIYMTLHYVVQGHRFDIIEDFGCRASTYVSIASVFLVWVPPLFFSFGAFILSALAFRNFWMRRITFARHLQTSNSALTPSRYFRLMAMSLVQMFWGLVIISLSMWFTMKRGLRPWISWEDVHFEFSRIGLFPKMFIPRREFLYTFLLWWTLPISSFLFFAFFSFGQDAMKEYRECYLWVRRRIFRLADPSEKFSGSSPLPSLYVVDAHRLDFILLTRPSMANSLTANQKQPSRLQHRLTRTTNGIPQNHLRLSRQPHQHATARPSPMSTAPKPRRQRRGRIRVQSQAIARQVAPPNPRHHHDTSLFPSSLMELPRSFLECLTHAHLIATIFASFLSYARHESFCTLY
uniref:Pheromone receptor n=1 Tax=Agrocybe salicacicola TaxID=1078488 RepID=A0A2P0M863_9AGAR|nr:pheromone receptor [Agrocybe salicacicola]